MTTLLTNLSADLYEGLEVSRLELAPITLVRGPNEAGKSLLLSIPGRLLRGPAKGDDGTWRADGTWLLPGGRIDVSRTCGRGGHTVRLNGQNTRVREADQRIAARVGNAWSWSPQAFADLSGRKRTGEVRRFLDMSWTVGWVQDQMLADPGFPFTLNELHALLPPDALEVSWSDPTSPSGQAYLTALVEGLQEAWRAKNAEVKNLRGAAATTAQDLERRKLPARTPAAVQSEISTLDTQINATEREIGKHAGALEGLKAIRQAVLTAERMLTAAADRTLRAKQAVSRRAEIIEKREAASQLRAELEQRVADRTTSLEEVTERLGAAETRAAVRTAFEASADLRDFTAYVEAIRLKHESLAADQTLWNLLARVREASASSIDVDVDLIKAERNTAQFQLAAANRRLANCHMPELPSDTSNADMNGIEPTKTAHQTAHDAEREAATALEELRAQMAQAEAEAGGAERMVQHLEQLQQRRTGLSAELAQLQDAEALRQQAIGLGGREADGIRSRTAIYAAGKAIRSLESELLDNATGSLLGVAGALTQRVLHADLHLMLADGETHLVIGSRRLSQCSRSVQSLALTTLQIAVSTRLEGWRCPILDDVEMFELPRAERLLDGLAELAADEVIDQAILACVGHELDAVTACQDSGLASESVRHIDLERRT